MSGCASGSYRTQERAKKEKKKETEIRKYADRQDADREQQKEGHSVKIKERQERIRGYPRYWVYSYFSLPLLLTVLKMFFCPSIFSFIAAVGCL